MTQTQTEPLRTTKETHPNLPPGLILGPDGKVCKVCNSWQDWGRMKIKKKAGDGAGAGVSPSSSSKPAAAAAAVATGAAVAASSSSSSTPDRSNCPPDTNALGRATWTFLHTTAAWYPTNPTPAQQTHMRALLGSIPQLYPCTWCADDFGRDSAANPPDVSGREALSRWLCERHNTVNEKLGKKTFACDWPNLNARWKDGPADGSCD